MTNTRPEIEFAHVFPLDDDVKAVHAFGFEVPQEFMVIFFIRSLNTDLKVVWSIGLEIEITGLGVPQTKKIDFQGEVFYSIRTDHHKRNLYYPAETFSARQELGLAPVDFERVRTISSSTRTLNYLQSLGVAVAVESFEIRNGIWERKTKFVDLDSDEIKKIKQKFALRKSRSPRSNIDFSRVADLYKEAKSRGIPYVADFISVNYAESDEFDGININTVNNWIKTCRDLEMLPKSDYGKKKNSSPKAVKDASKPTTHKGKTNAKKS